MIALPAFVVFDFVEEEWPEMGSTVCERRLEIQC